MRYLSGLAFSTEVKVHGAKVMKVLVPYLTELVHGATPSHLLEQHLEQLNWGRELKWIRGREWKSGRGLDDHCLFVLHRIGEGGGGYK